jgi:adenylate cyclase
LTGPYFFPVDDAPLRALLASLEMMQELRTLNSVMKEREFGDVEIGVGIATGSVLAGNIGSLDRMEYTCIGATVNSAARLERLNREMGTHIIICESTNRAVRDHVPTKRLPPMKVRGKPTTGLYAVELPDDVPALIRQLQSSIQQAATAVKSVGSGR